MDCKCKSEVIKALSQSLERLDREIARYNDPDEDCAMVIDARNKTAKHLFDLIELRNS